MKQKRYHWLASAINLQGYTVGAEVGAATGNTTKYILDNCPWLDKLYVVDIWKRIANSRQWDRDDMEFIFREKFKTQTKIEILKGLSWEMAEKVEDLSLDFVFVDAAHDYQSVYKDIRAWLPKVKLTGMICGHDINIKGVRDAVEFLLPNYREVGIDNCWMKARNQIEFAG